MTSIEEAALALRDDPTFATMTTDERAVEAALLLGTDDPLDIALAVEAALAAPPAPIDRGAMPIEPCRLETDCGGRETVAGNGRCMTCGANRFAPEIASVDALTIHDEASETTPAKMDYALKRMAEMGKPIAASAEPLSARVKAALGYGDRELGELLGVARPTAQAYVSGRIPEQVDGIRLEYLRRALAKRMSVITPLLAEIESRIAASD